MSKGIKISLSCFINIYKSSLKENINSKDFFKNIECLLPVSNIYISNLTKGLAQKNIEAVRIDPRRPICKSYKSR